VSALLALLRERLEAVDYDAGLRTALGLAYVMTPPWMQRTELESALGTLPDDLRTAYRLWLLGATVPRADAESVMSPAVVDGLCEIGLLRVDDGAIRARAGLALVAYRGRYVFADDPTAKRVVPPNDRVYLGNHSYVLAHYMRPTGGSALDLGTGTGFLALQCADGARRVTASDVDERAVEAASLNVAMNGLGGRVEVVRSDLFEDLAGRRFDYICANVPFVPVPPDVAYPAFAAGGGDGLAFVRRIATALPDHLEQGGRCQMLALSPLEKDGARRLDGILHPLVRAGFRCVLQVLDTAPADGVLADNIATVASNLGADPASTRERWSRHYAESGFTGFTMLVLTIDAPAEGRAGALRVIGA
jgi:SAM-dependent methyltransferase